MLSWGLSWVFQIQSNIFLSSPFSIPPTREPETNPPLGKHCIDLYSVESTFWKIAVQTSKFWDWKENRREASLLFEGKGKEGRSPRILSREVVREHRLLCRGYFIWNINSTYSLYHNSWYLIFFNSQNVRERIDLYFKWNWCD